MESLGGQLAGPPTAVSWGPNRVDVFAAGPQGVPWWWAWTGIAWIGPVPLPGSNVMPAEGLAALTLGANQLRVFAAGQGNTPWMWEWNGGAWSQPAQLPAGPNLPAESVAVTSSGLNLLDVFGAGAGNTPWWWHWNGVAWLAPQQLPTVANLPAEKLAAISARPGRLDVFAPGAGNHLWHWSQDGAGQPWHAEDLGGNLPAEGVAVTSSGPNRIDVFAASRGGAANNPNPLQWWWWDGNTFHGPQSLGGDLTATTVSAVASGPSRLDVFGVSGDGHLVRWQWDGTAWSGPNPRGQDLPAGDLSAVAAGPGHIHVFARGSDNTLRHWPGGGIANWAGTPWRNFAGNQQVNGPAGHCYPGSLEELVTIVRQAEQAGRRVRAVGSSWSSSDVAVTPDYIVETHLLNSVLTNVTNGTPAVLNNAGSALKLVHVEAGITIAELNTLLDQRFLALKTMGGSSGQTLAGAVSTCVHGPDVDRGPLPDTVRAIHLVGPGGVQHWIEPSSPITDPGRLSAALGIDRANIHYEDRWFNSVLVSMGTMGIIYSVIVEVVDQYDLVENCQHLSWEALRAGLVGGQVFAGNPPPRAVMVAINPFKVTVDPATGLLTHQCYLVTRTEAPKTAPAADPDDPLARLWLNFAGLLNANPNNIETIVTSQTDAKLPQGVRQGYAHTIMGTANPPPANGLGLEIAFDATSDSYLTFVDEALQTLETLYAQQHLALGGWFSLRFVGRSRAYLAPQARFSRTCMAEFAGLWSPQPLGPGLNSTMPILAAMEALGRKHGGIQHWGMFYDMRASDVRRAFPNLDAWRSVHSQLTNGGRLRTFDNEFTQRCGLHEPHTDLALTGGAGWATIPVASSGGDGTFAVTNGAAANFAGWAQIPDVKVHVGDFSGDGRADLALTGGAGWATIPVASPNGDGSFTVSNVNAPEFAAWAQDPDVKVHVGDFNGDGRTDLALTGGAGWATIPVAFSNGDGTFTVTNHNADDFPTWAQSANVKVVVGDFNGDGRTDLALTGVAGWATIPVAFSNGDGTFAVTNQSAPDFAAWAQGTDVAVHALAR